MAMPYPLVVRAAEHDEPRADTSKVSVVAISTRLSVRNTEDEAAVAISSRGVDGDIGLVNQVF